VLPFWLSITLLSLVQGAVVTLPRALVAPSLERLRDGRWAVVLPASIIVFVFVARAALHASAQGLTYLALCAVPPLAALALGWLSHGARPRRALLALVLFAIAWADRGALPGEAAALALSAYSCVTLGVLLAAVTPRRWLALGIVAMAFADTALVVSDLLQRPNDALNAARPAAGLPTLQSAALGSAVMGYGDLFVAAVLGALLAVAASRATQLRGALLTAFLALAMDLLFFFIDELPATIPVALALVLLVIAGRRSPRWKVSLARDGRERRLLPATGVVRLTAALPRARQGPTQGRVPVDGQPSPVRARTPPTAP